MKTFLALASLWLFVAPNLRAQYFDLRDGNQKYLAGEYDEAKRRYDKIIAEEDKFENKKEAIFNSGNALYRMKKFDEAESDYRKIAENASLDPTLRSGAYYNIGNGYFSRAKTAPPDQKESLLKDAIKNYKESLKLNPNDLQAKQNLELAKAILKQMEEQKPKGNNQQDKQDRQEQNDKNKQDQRQNNQDPKGDTNKPQQNQNDQNQNRQDGQNKPPDPKPNDVGQGEAQISRADAEKLLDALKQDEKQMLKKYLMKKANQTKYEKDW
ncbi:MAG: hypothetical protein NZM06_00580 [Chloroherpetonaceae bacterium]|nr:hypothetical protein [Chloroherpetonaceae bacterium]MDW8438098.1 hypothetical protein [Chloroherpetonaceae bacterium]